MILSFVAGFSNKTFFYSELNNDYNLVYRTMLPNYSYNVNVSIKKKLDNNSKQNLGPCTYYLITILHRFRLTAYNYYSHRNVIRN